MFRLHGGKGTGRSHCDRSPWVHNPLPRTQDPRPFRSRGQGSRGGGLMGPPRCLRLAHAGTHSASGMKPASMLGYLARP